MNKEDLAYSIALVLCILLLTLINA